MATACFWGTPSSRTRWEIFLDTPFLAILNPRANLRLKKFETIIPQHPGIPILQKSIMLNRAAPDRLRTHHMENAAVVIDHFHPATAAGAVPIDITFCPERYHYSQTLSLLSLFH